MEGLIFGISREDSLQSLPASPPPPKKKKKIMCLGRSFPTFKQQACEYYVAITVDS